MTAQELFGYRHEPYRQELIEGRLYEFQLASDPDTVRAPDAAFIARERVPASGIPRGSWPGPPDLAVEVVSRDDGRSAVEAKALDWLAAGTRAAVVVVDPRLRTAMV